MNANKERVSIAAVVVTYNRKELLRQNLNSLLTQTRPLDEIIVVNNASTDGTAEMLAKEFKHPQITVLTMPKNIGGAGGFHEGMKLAYEKGHDWIWVMDDDTIPYSNALNMLLSARVIGKEDVGLLCSHVMWIDGSPHIMNIPQISPLIHGSDNPDHHFNQHIEKGLLRIYACSFVSTLISRRALEKIGLPIKEMFIYGDDIEFTGRICTQFPCYYVIQSKVLHKTNDNRGCDLTAAPDDQLWKYFFAIRNRVYLCRRRGLVALTKFCLVDLPQNLIKVLQRRQSRLAAVGLCLRGLIAGLFFHPKITKL